MARSQIPVTTIDRDGVEVPAYTTSDATNDHYIAANAGDVELEVKNENASPQTVTVVANPSVFNDGLTLNDLVLTIPAGKTYMFGPFRPNTFKQDAAGMMYLNPSVSTDLKIRAFKREQARN